MHTHTHTEYILSLLTIIQNCHFLHEVCIQSGPVCFGAFCVLNIFLSMPAFSYRILIVMKSVSQNAKIEKYFISQTLSMYPVFENFNTVLELIPIKNQDIFKKKKFFNELLLMWVEYKQNYQKLLKWLIHIFLKKKKSYISISSLNAYINTLIPKCQFRRRSDKQVEQHTTETKLITPGVMHNYNFPG